MWCFPIRKGHVRGAYIDAHVAAETAEAGGCELPDSLRRTHSEHSQKHCGAQVQSGMSSRRFSGYVRLHNILW